MKTCSFRGAGQGIMQIQKRTKVKDSRLWINTEILKKKSEKATKTLQAEKEDR
jgi:hypothetical protein